MPELTPVEELFSKQEVDHVIYTENRDVYTHLRDFPITEKTNW